MPSVVKVHPRHHFCPYASDIRMSNALMLSYSLIEKMPESKPLVAVVMGSKSDWDVMRTASETLTKFGVAHESRVMSAHRSPALTSEYASNAEKNGIEVIIAAAGGAAHLAGVFAAHTVVPVLGVPMESQSLGARPDSLLSTVQMLGEFR